MAQRRMFSLKIIDTDIFLDMPLSAQALYFHLSMRADDDGFVSSPKRILKTISCSEDDFKILLMKQFILPFESGICVIKDWKIHNYIQKDRYTPSIYNEEKSMLLEDKNGSYTKCIQNVDETDTQVRLELVKSKDSIELVNKDFFTEEQKLKANENYPNIDLFYYEERIKEYELKINKPYTNKLSALNTFVKRDIKQRGFYEEIFVKKEKVKKTYNQEEFKSEWM